MCDSELDSGASGWSVEGFSSRRLRRSGRLSRYTRLPPFLCVVCSVSRIPMVLTHRHRLHPPPSTPNPRGREQNLHRKCERSAEMLLLSDSPKGRARVASASQSLIVPGSRSVSLNGSTVCRRHRRRSCLCRGTPRPARRR